MPEATPDLTAGSEPAKSARDIVRALMTQAAGDAPEWSALGLARAWAAALREEENRDEEDEPFVTVLRDVQNTKLRLLAEIPSRNSADIAAKLAAVVLKTACEATCGDLPAALHRITASALADVVLMSGTLRQPMERDVSSAMETDQQAPAAGAV